MKKIKYFGTLLLTFLMASCTKASTDISKLSILTPTGAPAVAFYNYADNEMYTTNATPANIVAMMNQNGPDIVVIDGLTGIKALKNEAPYQYLATITFGNFFIAKTGNDDNDTLDENDSVLLFGQGQTPDVLFNKLYANLNIKKSYVANVNQAGSCLCAGKNTNNEDVDYVLIAQPILQKILNDTTCATYQKAAIYASLQEQYKNANGDAKIIQASVFVKKTVEKEVVKEFAKSLKKDIENAIANPELIKQGMGKVENDVAVSKYGIAAAMAAAVLKNNNGLGLGFAYGKDLKNDFQIFLNYFNEEMFKDEFIFDYEK